MSRTTMRVGTKSNWRRTRQGPYGVKADRNVFRTTKDAEARHEAKVAHKHS